MGTGDKGYGSYLVRFEVYFVERPRARCLEQSTVVRDGPDGQRGQSSTGTAPVSFQSSQMIAWAEL